MEKEELKDWGNFFGSLMIPISFTASILTDSHDARAFIMIVGIFSFIVMKTCEEGKE